MVYYEDLEPIGVMHNSKYAVLFERAQLTYWARGLALRPGDRGRRRNGLHGQGV
jgi:acyl-CoA thioesterase FadM